MKTTLKLDSRKLNIDSIKLLKHWGVANKDTLKEYLASVTTSSKHEKQHRGPSPNHLK